MPSFIDSSGAMFGGLYLALVVMVGYTVLCSLSGGHSGGGSARHWLELLGLSFALGAGTVSTLLFFFSLAGHVPGRGILSVIAIVTIAGIFLSWHKSRLIPAGVPAPRGKFDVLTPLGIAGLALIVSAIANALARANWIGLNDVDAFGIWMFKAKVLALTPLRPVPWVLTMPTLSYSHQDYPLSLPFLVAGLYAAIGHINDEQAKIVLIPVFLSLTSIMYSAIRRMHRRASALALTGIFVAAPVLAQNAGWLVAETPLVLFWTATIALLLRWMETHHAGDLRMALLLAAFTAFTKNEGIALLPVVALSALVVAVLTRKRAGLKDWSVAILPAFIAITPWLIYRTFLPKTHEDYGDKLTNTNMLLRNLGRLGYILPQFLGRIFDAPKVGLIGYLLILIAIGGYRGFARLPSRVLWIIVSIQLALYIGTFVVTPWPVAELVPMIGPKLLIQASPVATLLIALHLRETGWPRRVR